VRLEVGCRLRQNRPSFRAAQSRLQSLGDVGRDIAFDGENIVQLAIVALRPKMRVVPGIDELDMDSHPIAGFAHRAFENVRYAKLLCDLGDVFG